MAEKKIAVLLGQAEESYQQEVVLGISKKAIELGYRVYAFSMFIKYQNSKEREIGDSNIFNLINFDSFDAVIVLSDTIQTPGVEKRIEEKIHKSYKGPVLCIDSDSEFFNCFWTDGYDLVYATISHLIEVHGLKDIAYLTGRKYHVHSKRRLQAYKDAMENHGLEVREDRIFYGDYWYTSGTAFAETLLRNKDNLPEAVACANDCMAIGFADEMTKHGVRIPEDLKLFGYGTTEEGSKSPKALSSTIIPAEYYGRYAVETIDNIINEREIKAPEIDVKLFVGESCGCELKPEERKAFRRSTWMTKDSEEGYYSIHNYMMEDLLLASTLEEFFRIVYEHTGFLKNVNHIEICLNSDWLDDECILENRFPTFGYSDRILNVLSYDKEDSSTGRVDLDTFFESKKMVPWNNDDDDNNELYLFEPLFSEDKSFGYVILGYESSQKKYNESERLWLTAMSRGLESYRRLRALSILQKKLNEKQTKFPFFVEKKSKGFSKNDMEDLSEVEKILNENLFKYHFQPIVNAVDGEIYSYEALMRSNSGKNISPLQIIKLADAMGRLSDVEKYTFKNVLKILDERQDLFNGKKVFINSIPGLKLEYKDFSMIEDMLKKQSDKAVVELTEQAEIQDEELDELKDKYRRLGIGLAVDDYGTGYSNVGNLLRYMPDIVKIDRSLLSNIHVSSQKQHFVIEIIDFCHANGILALAEGVETAEELRTVIRLGADLIQGYYVARPAEEIIQSVGSNIKMEIARYHREREDGSNEQTFIAGRVNRIAISHLIKENKNTVVVGSKDSTFKDITIVGTPNTNTGIHIDVLEGYDGRITLENVNLSSKKNRPCIHMAEKCKLTLRIEGENTFRGGGIMVPETSSLTMEGLGNLKIIVSGGDNYGIGNALDKKNGKLDFYQDGEIYVESNGKNIIGIGSGLGGGIEVHRGKYVLALSGDEGVGLGSIKGDDKITIQNCDFYVDSTFYKGVAIGNMKNDSHIEASSALLRFSCDGKTMSILGSISGNHAYVSLKDLNMHVYMNADYSTAFGTLEGSTDLRINTSGIKYSGTGSDALVYGGYNENSDIIIQNASVNIDLRSGLKKITNALPEKIHEINGSSNVMLNGFEVAK